MIQARTCDELSRRQAHDWRTHGHTQATTIPEGQNWFWFGSLIRRSKFPFSELKLMWYRLKNISFMICGCRCQLGPTGINYANNSWSYGAPIGVVFLIPINLASGAAVAWCVSAQRGPWSGSYSPSESTKSYITTTKECISVRKAAIKFGVQGRLCPRKHRTRGYQISEEYLYQLTVSRQCNKIYGLRWYIDIINIQ